MCEQKRFSREITITLQDSVWALGPALGFLASNVSASALHAARAIIALLWAHVNSNTIRLLLALLPHGASTTHHVLLCSAHA
jgi:hypothetical protein